MCRGLRGNSWARLVVRKGAGSEKGDWRVRRQEPDAGDPTSPYTQGW